MTKSNSNKTSFLHEAAFKIIILHSIEKNISYISMWKTYQTLHLVLSVENYTVE